jgi:F-type H+-transporting ATPase subunit b
MDLLIPEFGTIIWSLIVFSIVVLILGKYAWKPMLKALKQRDLTIAESLQAAEKAKREVGQLQLESEKLMAQAKVERDKMLQEARELKESLMHDAREQAKKEGLKMIEDARQAIKTERAAAIQDIKNQVSELSVAISEKILLHELSDPAKQKQFIEKSLVDVKFS